MSYLAISQLIILSCCVFLGFRRHLPGQLLVLFCLCLIAYILTFLIDHPVLTLLLHRFATASPAVLWLLAVTLFVDSGKVSITVIGIMVLYMVVRAVRAVLLYAGYDFDVVTYWLIYMVPQLVMLGFALHAIYLGFAGHEDDLVEERRRLRIPFVIYMGILGAIIICSGFIILPLGDTPITATLILSDVFHAFFAVYAFFITLKLNLIILVLHPDAAALLMGSTKISIGTAASVRNIRRPDLKVIARIRKLMEEERMYQQTGLTISSLAEVLAVPEHRLRKVINQQMHFRNFNQFLNSYRVGDASTLLQETDKPIANIALDVGYRSLSSFNKVFKEIYGVPPREYRQQARVAGGDESALNTQGAF